MSDSDDTDILLLIPPNYFIAKAESQLQVRQKSHMQGTRHMDGEEFIEPSSAYQFLPQSKKAELNDINAQLQRMQQHANDHDHFSAPSDISSISDNTVRTTKFTGARTHQVVHSTPKCGSSPLAPAHDGVLQEIDQYFDEQRWRSRSNENVGTLHAPSGSHDEGKDSACNLLPNALHRLSFEQPLAVATPGAPHNNSNLISLSELWGRSGHMATTAIGPLQTTTPSSHTSLKEEQLRRQHLERTVHSLQSQLLEYQQRLSVAIEVDRNKDAALASAQADTAKLQTELHGVQDQLQRANAAQVDNADKLQLVERELAQAMTLASKFQDKNEKLEAELTTISRQQLQHKEQLEDLELKLLTSRRSEDYANSELQKLTDKLAKAEYLKEKIRVRCDELEQERATLRQQKDTLLDMQQKAKQRADTLDSQRKTLQETVKRNEETETTLQRKIELQQKSLKAHYQQQLEHVVAQKLREFQEQLDRTEETLRAEARDRERFLAERAVKQLELINEKSELELNLLQEKHNEEVELYRIQLANASKKIDALEAKLNSYKSKRADMAERLHGVMEAQWQKALEILTSPSNQTSRGSAKIDTNGAEESAENNETHYHDDQYKNIDTKEHNGEYETPKNNKHRKAYAKENNLNAHRTSTEDKDAFVGTQPIDRLQAYIELLLSKSPSDFDKLDEILALSKRSKGSANKWDKSAKHNHNSKPPWKA